MCGDRIQLISISTKVRSGLEKRARPAWYQQDQAGQLSALVGVYMPSAEITKLVYGNLHTSNSIKRWSDLMFVDGRHISVIVTSPSHSHPVPTNAIQSLYIGRSLVRDLDRSVREPRVVSSLRASTSG
jgi:hypothetical protein